MPKGKRNEPRVRQAPVRQPIRRRRAPAAQDAEEAPNGPIAVQEPAVPVQLVHVPVPNPMVIQQNMPAAPPMPQNPNDALSPPRGLTVFISGNIANIEWIFDDASAIIKSFQITYETFGVSGSLIFRITKSINGIKRSYTIRGLIPLAKYKIFMVTIGTTDVSNASSTLEFTTDIPDNKLTKFERSGIYPEEIIFIAVIIVVWIVAVVVFLKQWNSIRILEPIEPRYRHKPKNLESIRVVKRTQDSVIYKGYNRKLSITMVEREKRRLQRMHTAPVLPVAGRLTLNTLPPIQMEDMTTEM